MVSGFSQADFDIFSLPTYAERMPAIRTKITPKLRELGEVIAPRLSEESGMEFHPHVALHMRRTVNAPVITWVAFGRSHRSYKPFVHFRLAIEESGMRVSCFLEDDADDKPAFATALKENASKVAGFLHDHPEIHSYDLLDAKGAPTPGSRLSKDDLTQFADRLKAVKGQHAQLAIPVDRKAPGLSKGDALEYLAIESMNLLLPLYRMGTGAGFGR